MVKSTNKYKIVASIINLMLILFGIVSNVQILQHDNPSISTTVSTIFSVIALLAGASYICYGYEKVGAKSYKAFMILYAFAQLSCIVGAALMEPSNAIYIVSSAIVYGPILLLALSKDMGKKVSYNLAGIIVGLQLLVFVGSLISKDAVFHGSRTLSNLILAVTACVMVWAKYDNKASRGTK